MNRHQRRELIEFLTPLPCMQSATSRRATLLAAGLDLIVSQVDLSGSSLEAVTTLVYALEHHGTIESQPALVVFLEEIATLVGQDKQRQIQEFCRHLDSPASADPAPPPPQTPQNQRVINVGGNYFEQIGGHAQVYTGQVTIHQGQPPMPSPSPSEVVDVELGIHRRAPEGYQVELRVNLPDSQRLDHRGPCPVSLPGESLRALELDPEAYGRLLGQQLFSAPQICETFTSARRVAESHDRALRLRLFLAPEAAELHHLRWETLRDPSSDRCLLTDAHIRFSRYLSSSDWRPEFPALTGPLRVLIAVANPRDLADYGLPALDVADEVERVSAALPHERVTVLASPGQVTVEKVIEHLREGCDVLSLSAHGRLVEGEPYVWLESAAGKTQRVSGRELVTRMQDLARPPRLVVLSSCQSAGTGEWAEAERHALTALGPRLVQAGIPAVIAMQGTISIRTAEHFMRVFFQELRRDGLIDRAMAVARGAVRDRPDWYRPVLLMHLKDGRLWEE